MTRLSSFSPKLIEEQQRARQTFPKKMHQHKN